MYGIHRSDIPSPLLYSINRTKLKGQTYIQGKRSIQYVRTRSQGSLGVNLGSLIHSNEKGLHCFSIAVFKKKMTPN